MVSFTKYEVYSASFSENTPKLLVTEILKDKDTVPESEEWANSKSRQMPHQLH